MRVATTDIAKKLFTVDEFHAMIDAGIFDEDSRLELIEGEIFEMSGPGPFHVACVNRATTLLVPPLVGKAIVSVQNPLQLNNYTEPQPDIVVVKHRKDFYATARILPPDTLLVIEVSDSSLYHDLKRKLPLYAKAKVPEVWIEDLTGGSILVFRDRHSKGYTTSLSFRRGDSVSMSAFPGLRLKVDDLLGPADEEKPEP